MFAIKVLFFFAFSSLRHASGFGKSRFFLRSFSMKKQKSSWTSFSIVFHTAGIFSRFWCSIFINFQFSPCFPPVGPARWIFSSREDRENDPEKRKKCLRTVSCTHFMMIIKSVYGTSWWRRKSDEDENAKRFRVNNVSDFSPCRRARVARSENSVSLISSFRSVTKKPVENFEMSGWATIL